ncbi:hypothetical protein BV22DRAFT_806171 [Leucogyrophana mollusca]|uniref:Uncharacterized protein n=1 Tax=Leucogyrophana mollusca TaxID=85980 RepID=A0ACB8B6C3_9AGAM|nr:hypothetical protein BV22DRAFT_806171 [Leucogyrophana mollusca]
MSETPAHVILWGVPKPPDAPSPSGFCQKLETFLRFSSMSYELRDTFPSNAPKGKVPYADIQCDGKSVTIPDSHFIISHLIEKGIADDPDDLAGLSASQRAESRAWQAYIEEVYLAVVYERWYPDANYAVTSSEIFAGAPWLIRPLISWWMRRRVVNGLWAAGVGRHSVEEVNFLEKEAFAALEARLSSPHSHPYFHGDKPSRIDLTIYGFLANILGTKGNPYISAMVLKSPALIAFVQRLTTTLFPEYKQLLGELEKAQMGVVEGA